MFDPDFPYQLSYATPLHGCTMGERFRDLEEARTRRAQVISLGLAAIGTAKLYHVTRTEIT